MSQLQTIALLMLTWYFFTLAWQAVRIPAFLVKNDLAEQLLSSPISSRSYVKVLQSKLLVAATLGLLPYLAFTAANNDVLLSLMGGNYHNRYQYYQQQYYYGGGYNWQGQRMGWWSAYFNGVIISTVLLIISTCWLTYWSLVARRAFIWLPIVYIFGIAYIQLSSLRRLDESLWLIGTTILLFVYVFGTLVWCARRNNLKAFAISSFSALGVHTLCMKYPEVVHIIDRQNGIALAIWAVMAIIAGYGVMTFLKFRYAERLRQACFG
jgi:hypothetical protein